MRFTDMADELFGTAEGALPAGVRLATAKKADGSFAVDAISTDGGGIPRNVLLPGQRIEMNLQEGPFTSLHGVWEFKALGDKACKISLDLTFDYAGPLVRATLGPLFNQAANTMVDAFCQRAKQLYG